MMMNTLLETLPTELLWEILSHYLQLRDVCRLDSAVTQHSLRPSFLTLLTGPGVVFRLHRPATAAQMLWCIRRSLSIDHFSPLVSAKASPQTVAGLWRQVPFGDQIGLKKLLRACTTVNIDQQAHLSTEQMLALLQATEKVNRLTLKGFKKLPDSAIEALVHKSPALHTFDLAGCWQLTDDILGQLATKHGKELREVDVSACFNLSNAALIRFAKACPNLTSFKASFSSNVNDDVVLALMQHCPKLQSLVLAGCVALSDQACSHVATFGKALRLLDISGVSNLTDDSLLSLIQSTHKTLFELNLERCHQVTKDGVKRLISRYPALQKISLRSCLNIATRDLLKEVSESFPDSPVLISA